jgi:heme/copper-type cytochrome/quinol oxidase subunit 3
MTQESAFTSRLASRPPAAPSAPRRNTGLIGAVFFIVSESMFFLGLFLAYFYLRGGSQAWPPPDVPPLSPSLPLLNSALMAVSVACMAWADRGLAAGNRRRLQAGLTAAACLGLVFMVIQSLEFAGVGFGPGSNAYGSSFFFLMGFHVARVFGGVVFMVIVLARALIGQFSPARRAAVQACALYWYFIAAVWAVVFAVLYVVR